MTTTVKSKPNHSNAQVSISKLELRASDIESFVGSNGQFDGKSLNERLCNIESSHVVKQDDLEIRLSDIVQGKVMPMEVRLGLLGPHSELLSTISKKPERLETQSQHLVSLNTTDHRINRLESRIAALESSLTQFTIPGESGDSISREGPSNARNQQNRLCATVAEESKRLDQYYEKQTDLEKQVESLRTSLDESMSLQRIQPSSSRHADTIPRRKRHLLDLGGREQVEIAGSGREGGVSQVTPTSEQSSAGQDSSSKRQKTNNHNAQITALVQGSPVPFLDLPESIRIAVEDLITEGTNSRDKHTGKCVLYQFHRRKKCIWAAGDSEQTSACRQTTNAKKPCVLICGNNTFQVLPLTKACRANSQPSDEDYWIDSRSTKWSEVSI